MRPQEIITNYLNPNMIIDGSRYTFIIRAYHFLESTCQIAQPLS